MMLLTTNQPKYITYKKLRNNIKY